MELTTVMDLRKNNGRPKGCVTYKKYKWHINLYDKDTSTFTLKDYTARKRGCNANLPRNCTTRA